MSVRKITSVSSSEKVVCVKFSITIMINQKIMNKIFDASATPFLMPNYPYIVFVESIPVLGFNNLEQAMEYFREFVDMVTMANVSLFWNSKYGYNKETSDV